MADLKQRLELEIVTDETGAIKGIKNLNTGLKSVDDSTKKAEKSHKSFFDKLKSGYTIAAGIIGGIVVKSVVALIKKASDAQETFSKFNTVFKEVSVESENVAKNLSNNFGLSSIAAKKLLSDTGDLLTGFGFTGKSALDLSKQVNELAVDLASFTNYSGGAEGASAALTKALLGERESVKSLGISILESDVKAKVLENTQKGLTFETERQAKAYATLQIAQDQSKNAIGDFSRTSGSLANIIRQISARFEDVAVSIGSQFIPALEKAGQAFADFLNDTTEQDKALRNLNKAQQNYLDAQKELNAVQKDSKSTIDDIFLAKSRLKDADNKRNAALIQTVFAEKKLQSELRASGKEIKDLEEKIKVQKIIVSGFGEAQKKITEGTTDWKDQITLLIGKLGTGNALLSDSEAINRRLSQEQDKLQKQTIELNRLKTIQNEIDRLASERKAILAKANNYETSSTEENTEAKEKQKYTQKELNDLKEKFLKGSLTESEAIQNQIKDINAVILSVEKESEDYIKLIKIKKGLIDQLSAEEKTKEELIKVARKLGDTETDFTNLTIDQSKERIKVLEQEKMFREKVMEEIINLAKAGFELTSTFIDRRLEKLKQANDEELQLLLDRHNAELEAIDERYNAELEKAGGINEQLDLIEEEARQKRLEDLQAELDAAILAGDTELAHEKENAIKTINLNKEKDDLLAQQAKEKAELEATQAAEKEAMEKKQAHNTAVVQRKAAIVEKVAALFSIAAQTAVAIMRIWADLLPGKITRTVLVGGTGLTQAGAVLAKPLPEVPSFQFGGTIGGPTGTDKTLLRGSRGETMINTSQGQNLFNALEKAGLLNGAATQSISNTRIDQSSNTDRKFINQGTIIVQGDRSFDDMVNKRLAIGGSFS